MKDNENVDTFLVLFLALVFGMQAVISKSIDTFEVFFFIFVVQYLASTKPGHHIAYTGGKIVHRLIQKDDIQTAIKQAVISQHVDLFQVLQETKNTDEYNDVLASLVVHFSAAASASTSDNYCELFGAGISASMQIDEFRKKYLPAEPVAKSSNQLEVLKNFPLQLLDSKNHSETNITKISKRYLINKAESFFDTKLGFDSSVSLIPGVPSPSLVLRENVVPMIKQHKDWYRKFHLQLHPEDQNRFLAKQILSENLNIQKALDAQRELLEQNDYESTKSILSDALKNMNVSDIINLTHSQCITDLQTFHLYDYHLLMSFNQNINQFTNLIDRLYRWRKKLTVVAIIGGCLLIGFKKRRFLKRFIKKLYRLYKIVFTNRFVNNRVTRSILTLARYARKSPCPY